MSINVSNEKHVQCQIAGRIRFFIGKWKELTSDPTILSAVTGYKIKFLTQPVQLFVLRPYLFSSETTDAIDQQVSQFLDKGIIKKSSPVENQFISTIFLRPKKDGSFRMILNLKELNKFVEYEHFKMDSIYTSIELMRPTYFMASIDLKDAYFSVPIDESHQKYFKFEWQGVLYQFTCLAQGVSSAPRLFTKLLKPVFAYLRRKGYISSGYLDDSLLMGQTLRECQLNVDDTLHIFHSLGFMPHDTKSITTPTQTIEHLGFVLNSVEMTVSISSAKYQKLCSAIILVLKQDMPSIRAVAQIIGMMVACFPGVEYGQLFYRKLEIEKIAALRLHKGDFDMPMTLSAGARSDANWWITTALSSKKKIDRGKIDLVIYTDASTKAWGASNSVDTTGGQWSMAEANHHINFLELKAVLLGLQSLCKDLTNSHIKVMTDNTTAVAYIRNMGGVPIHIFVMRSLEIYGSGAFTGICGLLLVTFQANIILLLIRLLEPLMIQRNGNLMLMFFTKLSASWENQTLICLLPASIFNLPHTFLGILILMHGR